MLRHSKTDVLRSNINATRLCRALPLPLPTYRRYNNAQNNSAIKSALTNRRRVHPPRSSQPPIDVRWRALCHLSLSSAVCPVRRFQCSAKGVGLNGRAGQGKRRTLPTKRASLQTSHSVTQRSLTSLAPPSTFSRGPSPPPLKFDVAMEQGRCYLVVLLENRPLQSTP